MRRWVPRLQPRAYDGPFVAEYVVQFEQPLLIGVAPLFLGMTGIDMGDISACIDAYRSLHCLPFRPFIP